MVSPLLQSCLWAQSSKINYAHKSRKPSCNIHYDFEEGKGIVFMFSSSNHEVLIHSNDDPFNLKQWIICFLKRICHSVPMKISYA